MKGILLAGGAGTRLYPMTLVASKQLLPVYDKPMIYYALSTLMLAGIQDILLISTPHDLPRFESLLGDGSKFGLRISYAEQAEPRGIAEAFLIGKEWIAGAPCALVLGDNIIYGDRLQSQLQKAAARAVTGGSTVFAYRVVDPKHYGVVQFDADGQVISLEEKPCQPKSDWAVIGIYFYDTRVIQLASQLRPSERGELEITDLNNAFIQSGTLHVEQLGRGYAWLDAGTSASLLQAAQFVQTIQERQGLQIGCPEEIAYRRGFLSKSELNNIANEFGNTSYGRYLHQIAEGRH